MEMALSSPSSLLVGHFSNRAYSSRCSATLSGRKTRRSIILTKASSSVPESSTPGKKSIICQECTGNGAKVCTSCKGDGLNLEEHFGGRFKIGEICWLCRGKKQILCGGCNGAGFVGGFLSTLDD